MDRDERQEHETGIAAQRRAQIIAATMRLIARDGVAALTTRTIAREAAVNLGTLHHLFGHKDDLLLAVLDAATSALIAALILVDGHPGGGLHAALTESFTALCVLLDREPALPLVRCEVLLYARGRPMQSAGAVQQQRYLNALAVCYRVAGAEGELGSLPIEELAAVVSSSIDSLALQTAMGVPLDREEATRAHMLRSLLTLVPGPPAGPQACGDGVSAARPLSLFNEAIRSVRTQ
jgi:AcrR family transcriptional regulator